MKSQKNSPRILIYDIETCPNLAWVWGHYEQNVIEDEKEWHILSIAYKWLGGENKTLGLVDYPNFKRDKEDDRALVKDIWKLFDEADIIIAHNGDEFDSKKCSTRFIIHGLLPPSPYRSIDTLKIARARFAFNSNKLNDLGKFLGIGQKVETGGFKLWKACMNGDPKAWAKMKKYNAQDVVLLEKVYKKFLPWIRNHANYGTFREDVVCPNCGSKNLQSRGNAVTQSVVYRRLQCMDCGTWSRTNNKERTFKILKNI